MTIRIVRLGTGRIANEGLRLGTVRRPPRGVPKSEYSAQNWYDVWFPNLSPSPETLKFGLSAKTENDWNLFFRKYRTEMTAPENSRTLDLLAAFSHQTNFSMGCYCSDEKHCHRSMLRTLLLERGAELE
ncbi:MAG: DUF488 family protein [Deltaproteobacteria bacterium]